MRLFLRLLVFGPDCLFQTSTTFKIDVRQQARRLNLSCTFEPVSIEMVQVSFNISITRCNWFNLGHVGLCTFLCKYAGLFFLPHKCGEIFGLTYNFLTMSFCTNFCVVLDVQIDESTTAGNAATRLTVT